ncbi:hypothetical protein ACFQBS_35570 [Planomonospora parontospora]
MSDSTGPQEPWPATVTPGTKGEMLRACERLRRDDALMSRLSARDLRSLLRPLWTAGATVRDVQHVLNHLPDGSRWFAVLTVAGTGSTVHSLRGWIRHRIGKWLTDERALVAELPSQRSARLAAAQRAEQAAFRAAYLRARERALPAAPALATADTTGVTDATEGPEHPADAPVGLAAVRVALAATGAGETALAKHAAKQARRSRWITST